MKVGILALQGAFVEHAKSLSNLNIDVVFVKLPNQLDGLDALIIPGGESTTISKLLANYLLITPIKKLINQGFPVFGTCAGMILLAKNVLDSNVPTLGVMDIAVRRNAYGRQVDSFETELNIPSIGQKKFHGIFIRAPIIEFVKSNVEVICKMDGHAVAVRQGRMMACTFHPELTSDLRLHEYFLDLTKGGIIAKGNNR
jgi:5'-phosphate synthase pdxT subunit